MRQRTHSSIGPLTVTLITLICPFVAAAQTADVDGIMRQVDSLTGVLREGLELNETPGFPMPVAARVQGVYLQSQGVLIEVRAPLATQRDQASISALFSSIRSLTGTSGQAARVERPNFERTETLALSLEDVQDSYWQLRERIRNADYERLIETAVREAESTAQSLRELGAIPADRLVTIRSELESYRSRVQDSLRDIGELDRERLETGTDEAVAALAARLEQFRQAQEEIRSRAVSQVAQLNDEYEQARLEDQQRWQAQIELLESRLFALLCDHGATLALVPGNERLTIRLTGLGDNRDGRRPGDKLHVIEMSELASCRLGEFDADELRGRAISYSY